MNALEAPTRVILLRLLRDYILPRWKSLLAGTLFAAATAALTGYMAALLQQAIDPVLANKADFSVLGGLPLYLGVLAVARGLAAIGQNMISNRVGIDMVSSIQVELVNKLLRADLARLRSTHSGGFLSQVLYDTGIIQAAVTNGFLSYVQAGFTIVALLAVMFTKDALLTLLVILVGPLIGWVLEDFSKRVRRALRSSLDGNAALATIILESLDGVRVIKMEGREKAETKRVAGIIAERRNGIVAGADARTLGAPVSEIMVMVLVAVVLAYFGWRLHSGGTHIGPFTLDAVTPGGFAAFLVALLAAGQSLRQFASAQPVMAEGVTGARRLFAALDIEPEIQDPPSARTLPAGQARVRFENVTFAYNDDATVLDNLSLEARRGEIVALVGPSGGGKTTILALIPRFYEVIQGRVSIDDHDLRDVTIASLREQIALVTQEPFLFDDTIAANIGYSRVGATQADIEAAARQAAAHEFILQLPDRYQTRVGEAGLRLSGGQRQRIAIARAFLKDAPILLLDEATSALDTESEAQVQAALERLMAGRTTILIAHRLSTVRNADRIYVIDHGRVVETGSHAELVRRAGLYSRLAGAQNLDLASEPVA